MKFTKLYQGVVDFLGVVELSNCAAEFRFGVNSIEYIMFISTELEMSKSCLDSSSPVCI